MVNAFNRVYAVYQSKKVNMRVAAYVVAIERLKDAMQARGWVG
ncbi:MAG: hypothetical protein PWR10_2164 [Halanaerobiales bacterium]|nr:hypothetical protein [Halanaerobiales bacterium]